MVPTDTSDHGTSMGENSVRLARSSGAGGRSSWSATDADRPRAKALAVPLASRRGSKSERQQKNSADLDLALNAKPDRPTSGCCLSLLSTVPEIKYDASGRKPALTRQNKFWIFFGSSRPKHNHEPQTDTAKHQCALIPTRRKIAFLPLGAHCTPPFSSGSAPSLNIQTAA